MRRVRKPFSIRPFVGSVPHLSKHGFPTRAAFVKAVSAEVFAHLPKPAPAAAEVSA